MIGGSSHMNEFFKNTNPAMRFMTNVANLILVNLLFIATCIPVITIGAALCGLYKVTFEIADGEEVFVFRDYFSTFIKKFKNATLLWLPIMVVDAVMFYSMMIVNAGLEGTASWMAIPPWIVVLISFFLIIYAFPYTANYEDTFKNTVSKCLIMGFGSLPTTIMLAVIHAAVIDVMLSTNTFQVVLGSILLFIGCGCLALLCTVFVRRVFKKFLVVENEDEEDGPSEEKASQAIPEEETATEEDTEKEET